MKDDVAPDSARHAPKNAASSFHLTGQGFYVTEDTDRMLTSLAEQGDLGALEQLLLRGFMLPPEIRLTQPLSRVLWKLVRSERTQQEVEKIRGGRKSRRGRLPDPKAEKKAKHAALYSFLLELDGYPTEAAVAETMQRYRMRRTTVFNVRRRWRSLYQKSGMEAATPERRLSNREWFEQQAQLFQSR